MVRRLMWFTVGMGVGVIVYVRASSYVRKKMPQAVTDTVQRTQARVRTSFTDFFDDARSAMDEREQELRESLSILDDDAEGATQPAAAARRAQ